MAWMAQRSSARGLYLPPYTRGQLEEFNGCVGGVTNCVIHTGIYCLYDSTFRWFYHSIQLV